MSADVDITEERIAEIIEEKMKEYTVRKKTPSPIIHDDDHHDDHHGSAWGDRKSVV